MRWTSTFARFRFPLALLLSLRLLLGLTPGRAQTVPAGQGLVADSTELRVLRQLYAATGGDTWTTHANWPSSAAAWSTATLTNAGTWTGVTLSQGDITQLSLVNNHLVSALPPSLGLLTSLRILDVRANLLTGPIPAQLGTLSQLQTLSLSSNRLTGALPPELGNLTQLTGFAAEKNQLTGPLPAAFGRWQKMSWLSLGDNQLTGPLPGSWGKMTLLGGLFLNNNQLSGPLPDSLVYCQSLGSCWLTNNHFTGSFPAAWGRLSHLYYLELSANQLSGPLPAALNQLTALGTLNLAGNLLEGPLPEHLEGLVVLQNLGLQNNRFSGPLPASLGQLPNLQYFTLSNNQFSGPLPAPTGTGWRKLIYLDASSNQLSGPLPPSLGTCTVLAYLNLSTNQLSGPLPAELGQLAGLQQFYGLRNAFSGPLPASLGRLANLQYLNLTNNQLSGPLPGSFGRLQSLRQCYLSTNQLTGPLPDSLRLLRQLAYLDLNQNRLSGALPASWKALKGLQRLNVQDNQLGGPLPDSLAAVNLYLDRNQFSGALPPSYATSPTLLLLSSAGNQLTQLPDFNVSPHLPTLRLSISDNWLEFDSYERNQPTADASRWYYWNNSKTQRQPPADSTHVLRSQAAQLNGQLGGVHNHYQWQRQVGGQWVDLAGQSQTLLSWPQVTAAEAGFYRTRVTNDWVTGITLYSRPHYLDPVPYLALGRNRPVDANQGPGSKLTPADSTSWAAHQVSAAAPDVNFVRVWSPRTALTDSTRVPRAPVDSVSMSTQYLDGLGRPLQTVLKQASPNRWDLVQPQAYDGLGREPRQYLPYPAAPTAGPAGSFRPQALRAQDDFYRRTTLPGGAIGPLSPTDPIQGVARTGVAFAESQFEASPLNRVTAQAAAGETWQLTGGHVSERVERPNTVTDSVLYFLPGYDPKSLDPGYQGFYAPGELWGTQTSEPHGPNEVGTLGYRTLEWKDKLGQVVLKQVEAARTGSVDNPHSRWLRTAYVYDDFGHLRFVLQPQGVNALLTSLVSPTPPPGPGSFQRQEWDNVGGNLVSNVPLGTPYTQSGSVTSLEGPSNIGDNYGDRLFGSLLPPQTGSYTFWVAGDDNAELWLSPDNDPAHQQRIAYTPGATNPREWTRFAQQKSALVNLVVGQRYYVEVRHKEATGNDHVAVSWRLPDGTQTNLPIEGAYLAPYGAPSVPVLSRVTPYLFHYRYDGRGRQLAKQVPGQDGETLVVYDQLDRPVLSQDASQRLRKEWSWTKYDALGRIILSGLTTRQDTMSQVSLQNLAAADTATAHQYEQRTADAAHYPQLYTTDQSFPKLDQPGQPTIQGFAAGQVLNVTRYDDYDFNNNGTADVAYNPGTDGQFPSGQAPVADALRTTGMVTQTKTRVLGVAEGDLTQAAWLTTTTFYDERARPVQVQTSNARVNPLTRKPYEDLLTTRLDFTGQVVQSVATHQGPSLATPLQVAEFFTYDHTGRLRSTSQQLPGEAQPALLDSVFYNEIGQATRKVLGTGRLKQDVAYAYNSRGWLTQVNDPYQPTSDDLFNLSLHYERGFTGGYEQYNGNLTGQTWRGRDGVQRAYGYVYDPLNRLLQGDFVARAGGGAGTLTTATPWNQEQDNYRLSFVSYDDNGNILTLRRRGLLQNATHASSKQYGAVDNLTYAYQGNRLQAVEDQVSSNQLPRPKNYNGAPTSLAGDFQEQGVHLSQEYTYDANGNLTADKNKGITGIVYNHLNLPRQIHFGQVGDSIVFRYSAAGQKVAKLVYQTGKPLARTDYLGPYQYEQDSLKFFPHSEGRVLRFVQYDAANQPKVSYQREFTFKDHLGNLRLAYRLGQRRTLTATLEQDDNTRKRETQQFDSLSVSAPIAQNVGMGLAHGGGSWVARLNAGGSAPQPLGPLTQLGVQQGDTVTVSAYGYYAQPVQHSFLFSLASFLTNLLHPSATPSPGMDGRKRTDLPLLQVGVASGLSSIPQLSGGVPQGYLRLLVFNKDSALVSQQTQQLSQAARGGYELLRLQVILPQDGYITTYVGSQSEVDVLFDDVTIEHRPGLQVQETEYDPAGLELAGLAPPSPGIKGLNNYRFNGKEFQADLGLAWNHQDWRFLDPQILRWHVGDPEIENRQESWTPYSFGYDNALRFNDPDGRCPGGCPPGTLPTPSTAAAILEWGVSTFESAEGNPAVALGALGLAVVGYTVFTVLEAGQGTSNAGSLGTLGLLPMPDKASYSRAQGGTAPTPSALNTNGRVNANTTQPASSASSSNTAQSNNAGTANGGPKEPYNRRKHYGNTPTKADRAAVGAGKDQVADHDPPLVKRYYEGDPKTGEKPGYQMTPAERRASGGDRTRMQPQPSSESNSQGGQMSTYSRQQKKQHGL